jgi:VWFA-related protein
MTRGFFVSMILLFTVATVSAQRRVPTPTPTPAEDTEGDVVKITTNLVQVDAVVKDKNGQVVRDLTADDFEIKEDGHLQKITNISFISTTASSEVSAPRRPSGKVSLIGPPVKLKAANVRRTVALVVDDLCLSWSSMNYVRRALRKFVDEQMEPGDLVAIIRTAGDIGVLQQFTADKAQLFAAIEKVKWSPGFCNRKEAFDELNESLQLPDVGVAPIDRNGSLKSSGKLAATKDLGEVNSRALNSSAEEFKSDVVAVGALGALSQIVRGLKDLPGRKAVLFISDGFKLIDKNSKGEVDPAYTERIFEAIQRVADLAGRSSVVVYTLDARGLMVPSFTAADQVSGSSIISGGAAAMTARAGGINDTQAGLMYLAQQAGGFAIYNNNDLAQGIQRVFDDQNGYYLIGYRPDESTFDPKTARNKFHKISLKVKRNGVSVRTRTGFYGVSEDVVEALPVARAVPLVKALISPFAATGIDVRLTSVFINDAQTGSYLRSLLHIDPHHLTFTETPDGWHETKVDVMAVTLGDNGQVVDQVNKTQTVRLRGETYDRTLREGLVYFLNVPVKKPGAYQFRIVVHDTVSHQLGSAGQFVQVPDVQNHRLALSGLVITGQEASNAKVTSASSPLAAKNQEAENVDSQSSAAVRRFRPGMILNYALVVYNPQLSKTTGRPELEIQLQLFKDGALVFSGPTKTIDVANQPDFGRVITSGGFQLGPDLGPGEYYLQAVVRDRLLKTRNSATQWIDFEMVK